MRQRLGDEEIGAALGQLDGWTSEGGALVKVFSFQTFSEGIAFVGRIAESADRMDHHPDIDIRYTKIRVALSTHDAGGITGNDVALAREIEKLQSA